MSNHMHHAPRGRGLKLAAWATGAYFFFEMGVGLYTGSVMVIVDAAHTFSAVGGVVLAIVARRSRISPQPADTLVLQQLQARSRIRGEGPVCPHTAAHPFRAGYRQIEPKLTA